MKKHPLADYRSANGLTTGQFAQLAGLHKSQISKIEQYQQLSRIETLRKIEEATGHAVTIADMVNAYKVGVAEIETKNAGERKSRRGMIQKADSGFSERSQQQFEPAGARNMAQHEAQVAAGMKKINAAYAALGGLVTYAPGFDPATPWDDDEFPDPQLPEHLADDDGHDDDGPEGDDT